MTALLCQIIRGKLTSSNSKRETTGNGGKRQCRQEHSAERQETENHVETMSLGFERESPLFTDHLAVVMPRTSSKSLHAMGTVT